MTDERYTFIEDVKEKKRTARGAHNKVTRGGRIKMPSDYLTAKEKKNLNGDVTTYSLNERLTWTQFRAMPKDIQLEYVAHLREHGASAENVRWYLGTGRGAFDKWCKETGTAFSKGQRSAADKAKWMAFTESLYSEKPEAKPEVKPEAQTTVGIENLFDILKALAGTGAKLTIEVTL